MVRWLAGLILCCGMIWGQRSDTIYQTLTIKTPVGGGPGGYTNNVTNIGQTGHTLFVALLGSGGGFCSTPSLNMQLQYSWDNVTFFGFGYRTIDLPGTVVTNSQTGTVQATGAFPYVRGSIAFNSACTAQIKYTGVVASPFPYVQGIIGVDTPILNNSDSVINPVMTGVVAIQGNGTGVLAMPYIGDVTTFILVGANQTAQINPLGIPGDRMYVDHLDMTADTNATVITLKEGTGTNCGTGSVTIGNWTVNAGVPLTIGRFRTQTISDNLCIGAVTGGVNGSITYGVMNSQAGGH